MNLKITIIQYDIIWEDIKANLNYLDTKINSIDEETNLVILPETFATGFSMNASGIFEEMNGQVVSWMQDKANVLKADIAGSIIIKESNNYYNRLLWVKQGGETSSYDKKYLFTMGGENKVFVKGNEHLTVELNGWKIRPFVCYDLRFPEWLRNPNLDYDLALVIANWPGKRADHWKTLLSARAIENQGYIIGVNRTGVDGNDLKYSGDSTVIDYYGKVLFDAMDRNIVHTHCLNKKDLEEYRKAFPVWMDF